MPSKPERRKYPRIKDRNIAVKLSGDGVSAITQSLDVSASGIYCKVDHRIPVMTRVQVVLSLPSSRGKKNSSTMEIEGVVVREHPVRDEERDQHYDIAIFFNSLMPKEKKKLMRYITGKTG